MISSYNAIYAQVQYNPKIAISDAKIVRALS